MKRVHFHLQWFWGRPCQDSFNGTVAGTSRKYMLCAIELAVFMVWHNIIDTEGGLQYGSLWVGQTLGFGWDCNDLGRQKAKVVGGVLGNITCSVIGEILWTWLGMLWSENNGNIVANRELKLSCLRTWNIRDATPQSHLLREVSSWVTTCWKYVSPHLRSWNIEKTSRDSEGTVHRCDMNKKCRATFYNHIAVVCRTTSVTVRL